MIHGFDDTDKTKVDLLNFFYPVGSIYETSNSSFNPNTTWGGTWVKIEGKFLLASGSGYNIGTTGGAASVSYTPAGTVGGHTLTLSEIPSHSHKYDSYAGGISVSDGDGSDLGILLRTPQENINTGNSGGGGSHNHGFTGTQATLNNMPPYEVVNVWKRTA